MSEAMKAAAKLLTTMGVSLERMREEQARSRKIIDEKIRKMDESMDALQRDIEQEMNRLKAVIERIE